MIGELEGGHALLFSSGTGAMTALLLAMLAPGATVAVAAGGYYGTVGLMRELRRWGLEVEEFDQTGEPPTADLVWFEPCSNPMLTFPDLDVAIGQAHASGAVVVVDNTVLSPVLLRPLEHGADFVLHSGTKILAGHHDALLGVVTCARAEDHARLHAFSTASGIVAAPDPAWLMLRGMKTLALRVQRQSATALELARRLAGHPNVERVRYPGLGDPIAERYLDAFGPLLSFDVTDADARPAGRARAPADRERDQPRRRGVDARVPRALRRSPSVPPGLLRLSVGLEDVDDLWSDLAHALDG